MKLSASSLALGRRPRRAPALALALVLAWTFAAQGQLVTEYPAGEGAAERKVRMAWAGERLPCRPLKPRAAKPDRKTPPPPRTAPLSPDGDLAWSAPAPPAPDRSKLAAPCSMETVDGEGSAVEARAERSRAPPEFQPGMQRYRHPAARPYAPRGPPQV